MPRIASLIKETNTVGRLGNSDLKGQSFKDDRTLKKQNPAAKAGLAYHDDETLPGDWKQISSDLRLLLAQEHLMGKRAPIMAPLYPNPWRLSTNLHPAPQPIGCQARQLSGGNPIVQGGRTLRADAEVVVRKPPPQPVSASLP